MIPFYARVAALDDKQDHLQMIVRGLGKAGFWAMPLWFDAGIFEPDLPVPLPGIRLVFTDIHMGAGPLGSTPTVFATTIINGLKKIVGKDNGPYGLIFWSQYPGDAAAVWKEIVERCPASSIQIPVGFGVIDKNHIIGPEGSGECDADNLRTLILDQVATFQTLIIAMSWDERIARSAAEATNRLYELATKDAEKINGVPDQAAWLDLMVFLAQEAFGKSKATKSPIAALDNALLPLIEDQLFRNSNNIDVMEDKLGLPINEKLNLAQANLKRPTRISATALNTHYLIDEVDSATSFMWERGMVTALGGGFRNSGRFISLFGNTVDWLIENEFALSNCKRLKDLTLKSTLCVVELSAECDQVQEKVATHRYLLALLVPISLYELCKDSKGKYANDSVKDIGEIQLKDAAENYNLLVSCRRFMVLPPGDAVDGRCRFRLRRGVVDELSHYYVTHSRRPGVLRFY